MDKDVFICCIDNKRYKYTEEEAVEWIRKLVIFLIVGIGVGLAYRLIFWKFEAAQSFSPKDLAI